MSISVFYIYIYIFYIYMCVGCYEVLICQLVVVGVCLHCYVLHGSLSGIMAGIVLLMAGIILHCYCLV